ncbi:MAG: ATP/GTP-binding protein [Ilumatobacteraceae bacterium]
MSRAGCRGDRGGPEHAHSPDPRTSAGRRWSADHPVKVVIAGGFGVGKTTMVGSVSEITPLTTEAAMTNMSAGVDDLSHLPDKTTTTVAMDFGRITISDTVVLYLFGTPGQDRFGFMWEELTKGALGAVVLVDSRRIAESFAAIDYFEHRDIPFVVAVNCFNGEQAHELAEIRQALQIRDDIPLVATDARERPNVRDLLITVLELTRERAVARLKAREATRPAPGRGRR